MGAPPGRASSTAAISTVCWFVKRTFQYVTHYGSANQKFADMNKRGFLEQASPPPLPNPPPLFPFLPIPYPLPLSTPATQANIVSEAALLIIRLRFMTPCKSQGK